MTLSPRFALGLVVAVTISSPAVAQKGGKDDARRFFTAGQKAFQAGRYVEAAKAFEEAFRIKPHPFPLINAGDAWEKAGELALAARTYQRVLVLEESGEQDRADATERLSRLAPKLGIIELKGESSIRARVNEDEVKGGDRVYVVPGEHVVTILDVEGSKERKLEIAAGVSRTVDLSSLMPGSTEEQPQTDAGSTDENPTPPPDADQGPSQKGGIKATTWLMFGVAAVAAGGAVYFGLQVNDAEKKYNDAPNQEDYDRFNRNKLFTNVSIGVAVLGAGLGTFFLLQDSGKKSETAQSARPRRLPFDVGVAPLSGGGAFVGSGRF